MRRFATLALVLLVAGTLAACGDDDTATSTPPDTVTDAPSPLSGEQDDEQPGDAPTAPSTGDHGTAIVDGTSYSFDQALRCDDDSLGVEGIEREVEAQFLGRSDEGRIQLDLYVSNIGGMTMHDVSWAGPEGVFGGSFTEVGGTWIGENDDVYQDAPITLDGARATGSVVIYDAMTMEDSIEVDFDVIVPTDTFACR